MEKKIILASKSPRRKQLLSDLYDSFDIVVSDADESLPQGIALRDAVRILAERKGELVAREEPYAVVISSDTLVALDEEPLGKPRDREDAYRMLRSLSGRWHSVHTGIAVSCRGRVFSDTATSLVRFRELSDEEIYGYIDTGEPFDKAGGYGIQGEAGKFVLEYTGDFDTIVGLSRSLTRKLVDEALAETKE